MSCNLASLLSGVTAPAVDLEALRVAAPPPHQGGQVELGAVGHRVDRVVGAEGRADRLLPANQTQGIISVELRAHPDFITLFARKPLRSLNPRTMHATKISGQTQGILPFNMHYLGVSSEASMALTRQTIFLAQSSESSMLAVRITSSTVMASTDLKNSITTF